MAVRKLGLRVSQGTLNAVQKSAEGEVGEGQAKLVRHSAAERWREQIGGAATSRTEGLNGAREGLKGNASRTRFSWATRGRKSR
jgi:hypothetical protein